MPFSRINFRRPLTHICSPGCLAMLRIVKCQRPCPLPHHRRLHQSTIKKIYRIKRNMEGEKRKRKKTFAINVSALEYDDWSIETKLDILVFTVWSGEATLFNDGPSCYNVAEKDVLKKVVMHDLQYVLYSSSYVCIRSCAFKIGVKYIRFSGGCNCVPTAVSDSFKWIHVII